MKHFYKKPLLTVIECSADNILTLSGEDSRFNLKWAGLGTEEEEGFAE